MKEAICWSAIWKFNLSSLCSRWKKKSPEEVAYFQCLFKCEILSTLFGHTVLYQDAISYEHHRRCCSWYCVIEKIIKWSVLPPLATIFSSIFVRHHRIQSWQSICTLAVLRHQTVIFSILTFAASQATSAKKYWGYKYCTSSWMKYYTTIVIVKGYLLACL